MIDSTSFTAPSTVYELRAESRKSASAVFKLIQSFERCGLDGTSLVRSDYRSKIRISFFTSSQPLADRSYDKFKKLVPRGIHPSLITLEPEDWFDKWKTQYRPFVVGKTLAVIPAWHKGPLPRAKLRIRVDPGAAFGSGMHETTRLVLQEMLRFKGQFRFLLDVGTGTGILAAAAHILGAKVIRGFDTDPLSVDAAKKNSALNKIPDARFQIADTRTFRTTLKFDLITANLHSSALIAGQNDFQKWLTPRGYLIVSGILKRDAEIFMKGFKPGGFRFIQHSSLRSWTSFTYQRKTR